MKKPAPKRRPLPPEQKSEHLPVEREFETSKDRKDRYDRLKDRDL